MIRNFGFCVILVTLVASLCVPFGVFAESDDTFVSQPCVMPILLLSAWSPDGQQVSYLASNTFVSPRLERRNLMFGFYFGGYELFYGTLGEDFDDNLDFIDTAVVPFRSSSATVIGATDSVIVAGDLSRVYYFELPYKVGCLANSSSSLVSYINANPSARPELFAVSYSLANDDGSIFTYTFESGRTLSFKWWVSLDIFYKFDGSQSLGIRLSFPAVYANDLPSLYYVGADMNGTFEQGFMQGYLSLFNTVDTNSASYKSGYDIAKSEWYNKGFVVGESQSKSWFGYLAGVAQAPIDFLRESLSFELLGVSMYDFVCSVLTVCALLVVIKAVSGV